MTLSVSAPPVSGVPVELAEIIDRLTAQIKTGEMPDLDAIVSDHPEYADELRRLLPAMKLLADLSRTGEPGALATGEFPAELGDLGDFRLIREVGRGGMGVVYEAEQLSLHRRVALKVLPFAATMDPRHLQRFKNEALAAASLRHENIVHVYGVGCERGVHFYAMEFIEGQTLAQLIHRLRGPHDPAASTGDKTAAYPVPNGAAPTALIAGLSTKPDIRGKAHYRRIAELIAQAADALEQAHSMGIVHRDVKPGNLLLDSAGKVYVSDFGLARFGDDASMTMSGDLIGTLRYMSPEQALARHGLVDHRTDIYSLGATLYELLTLCPAVEGDDKAEILKQIAWEEPTALRKHDRSVPVELETITLKCLAKNPNERYATASELAEDLKRWLGNIAIKAKPPGIRQRLTKWTRRHSTPVFAAAIALLIGTAVSTWQAFRAIRAEGDAVAAKQAETERADGESRAYALARRADKAALAMQAETNAIQNFLIDKIISAAKPKGRPGGLGPDVTVRQAVEAALPFVAKSYEGNTRVEARLRYTLGRLFTELGDYEIAAEQLQAARALYTQHSGPDSPSALNCMQALAVCYEDQHRSSEALTLNKETLALQKAKLGPDDIGTLGSAVNLARSYNNLGRKAEACQLFEETLALLKVKFPDHEFTFNCMINLAISYGDLGRFADAVKLAEETLSLAKNKFGPDHFDTVRFMGALARRYIDAGEHAAALELCEQTLPLQKAKLGVDHPDTLQTMWSLAVCYQNLDKHTDAIKLLHEKLALLKSKRGPAHQSTVDCLAKLAQSQSALGQHAEAIAGCRATTEMWEDLKQTDANSLYTAACLRAVTAAILRAAHKSEDAAAEDDRAMSWLKQAVAAGFKDAAYMKRDADFSGLRNRDDFKKLVAEVESQGKK